MVVQGGKKRRTRKHKKGGNVISDVNNWLKRNKLATKALKAINATGLSGPMVANPYGRAIYSGLGVASAAGYGRRGRRGGRSIHPQKLEQPVQPLSSVSNTLSQTVGPALRPTLYYRPWGTNLMLRQN